ncbi:MAG: FliI/YscN family ATPase [Sphingobium sp.]
MLNGLAVLLDRFEAAEIDSAPHSFGRLTACDGQLLEVSGLAVPIGTQCLVDYRPGHSVAAEVIGFRNGLTIMMLLADPILIRPGALVRPAGLPGLVPVGHEFLGRSVDGEGRAIDGGPPIRAGELWPVGGIRGNPLDRSPVRQPFDTGVRALNALTTFGIGQRVGIMAGSGVGKSVLLGMIADGARADVVIVGLIGERAREVSDFVQHRMAGEMRHRTVVVAVPADHAPNLRVRGALHATALAEYFRAQGLSVLLIMDSLTRVAHAAREIALLLGEPCSARGYPPSALSTLTKLVERAGNSEESGGAITGIYTVLADGDNQDDPVVDTARSILDGHIVLSRDLAQRNQYPAIDVAASLSRVMSDIVDKPHMKIAREFRALSATYETNRDLILMGAYRVGSDAGIDRSIAMHEHLQHFICQAEEDRVSLNDSIGQLAALLGHGQ